MPRCGTGNDEDRIILALSSFWSLRSFRSFLQC